MSVAQQAVSAAVAACLVRAASCLAACSRPALDGGPDSTAEQLSSSLTSLVSAAECFGCKPSFWRWAADAARLLGLHPNYLHRLIRNLEMKDALKDSLEEISPKSFGGAGGNA